MAEIILFNKPYGVLCQFTDPDGRPTLADYIKSPNYYTAGRLDADSEGLLVLTDQGKLQHRISSPENKMPKRYLAQLERVPEEADLKKLRDGIELRDGPTRPCPCQTVPEPKWIWPRTPPIRERKNIPTSWLELTLTEGRNRQIRRMTAAIGFPTLRLIRVQVGDWSLDNLAPGAQLRVPI